MSSTYSGSLIVSTVKDEDFWTVFERGRLLLGSRLEEFLSAMIMSADEDEPLSKETLTNSLAAAKKDKAPGFPIYQSIQSLLDVLLCGKTIRAIQPIPDKAHEDLPTCRLRRSV
jgi:hypothetical protein